jgi:hypothetical protein
MLDRRTVFILGAGASCPYGYPSAAHLREHICLSRSHPKQNELVQAVQKDGLQSVDDFKKTFENSSTKSIDVFMARNPKLAPVGKYVIGFEIFKAEGKSQFRERAKRTQEQYKQWEPEGERYLLRKDFQGDDWYLYLFNRLTSGLTKPDVLPEFSDSKIAFITFNYDRSLEYFLYESFRNSFTEVPEAEVIQCLKNLKILHVYGQIAPLTWQDANEGVDYRPQISEGLLRSASSNIKTIYEVRQTPEVTEARNLVKQADQIFFLGLGYAPENMNLLQLPRRIPRGCSVRGTGYGLEENEIDEISRRIISGLLGDPIVGKNPERIVIEDMDCLKLLRHYL